MVIIVNYWSAKDLYWKCFLRVQLLSIPKTNLHIWIEKIGGLNVSTLKRTYNSILISNVFFMPELKSWHQHIPYRDLKRCEGSLDFVASSVCVALPMIIEHFRSKRVGMMYLLTEVWTNYLILLLHITELHLHNGKSLIGKGWDIIRKERTKGRAHERKDTTEHWFAGNQLFYKLSPTTPNLSKPNQLHSFSQ